MYKDEEGAARRLEGGQAESAQFLQQEPLTAVTYTNPEGTSTKNEF
jgi:hypothetical protein